MYIFCLLRVASLSLSTGHKSSEDPKQCFGMALKKSPAVVPIEDVTDDDWRHYRLISGADMTGTVHVPLPRGSAVVWTLDSSVASNTRG